MPKRNSNKRSNQIFRGRKPARTVAVTLPRMMKYKLPSDQHHVALRWSGTYLLDVPGFVEQIYGVLGPGTRIPKYWTQYFGIWKYAYIMGIHFTFEIASTRADQPLRIVFAESNTQDATPTSYLELAETPRAVSRQVYPGGNQSVIKFSKSTTASAIMGHRLEDDKESWNTDTTGPTLSIQPVAVLGLEPIVAGGATQATIIVTIQYDIKYFTLNHL